MIKWLWRLLLLSLLSGLLVSSLLFFALYRTYDRLGAETAIATVRFKELSPQHYQLFLATPGSCAERSFPIQGDDWRIDARFIKWPNWLTVLGLEPQYRLDRVEGRFRDIDQANNTPHHAYALSPRTWVKPGWLDKLHFLIDTDYGSSVYASMDGNKQYVVYRSPSGLFTREAQSIPVLISPEACLQSQSYWTQTALWLDGEFRDRSVASNNDTP
ncbi:hypothetical protein [Gallaecimonas pentaromativorans]|uniref:hypothetical protein n=1 Tax=Gallaecimonas pentaromativorans TaxID=584787 RepID=UPI003A8D226E